MSPQNASSYGQSIQTGVQKVSTRMGMPVMCGLIHGLGVSLVTQVLYAIVFCSRYLDLFWSKPSYMPWNFVLKLLYIGSSFYIIGIMMRAYARTREREKAWKMGSFCLGGSAVSAPIVLAIFKHWHHYKFNEVGNVV